MFGTRSVALAVSAAAGLAACSIPGVPSMPPAAPPLAASAFSDVDPLPPGTPATAAPSPAAAAPGPGPSAAPASPGATAAPAPANTAAPNTSDGTPFTDPRFVDVNTPTKFNPIFLFGFDELRAGGSPSISTDVYQTADELEVREVRTLIERTAFRYDKLRVGLVVGDGRMDIGTPPKLTLRVEVKCTETDSRSYGVFSVKASGLLASVYLADLRVKDNDGNLSIVSISNFSRGNDADGRHTTERSARVVQRIEPGYIVLPPVPGAMRMRTLIYSESDPNGGASALRVQHQTLGLAP